MAFTSLIKEKTPGLGAEITTTKFQDQFLGKHVMENGTVALGVEKHRQGGKTRLSGRRYLRWYYHF